MSDTRAIALSIGPIARYAGEMCGNEAAALASTASAVKKARNDSADRLTSARN